MSLLHFSQTISFFHHVVDFTGNANLVYTIIRKRHVFHALANLPSDIHGISKCLNNRKTGHSLRVPSSLTTSTRQTPLKYQTTTSETEAPVLLESTPPTPTPPNEEDGSDVETKSDLGETSMEGSRPALPAEPGTLKASLLDTPAISQMTERESAHPLQTPLCDFNASDDNEASTSSSSQNNEPVVEQESVEDVVAPPTEPQEPTSLKRAVNQVCFKRYFWILLVFSCYCI